MIRTLSGNALNETIGVKDYSHFDLLFATHIHMEVHFIDFVKSLLVKNTTFPKFIKSLV